jgi:hypothetical protein
MSLYIVGISDSTFGDHDFLLIDAPTQEQAVSIFIVLSSKEPAFVDYFSELSVNMSFAERFWLDGPGLDDIVSDEEFRLRVYDFYGAEHRDWADLFIEHWNPPDGSESTVTFPPAQLAYSWVNSDYCEVIAFPVTPSSH